MISWKDSFEKISNELNLAKKKQNALEELHSNERISQFTYEGLNKTLSMEIEQIEARRKELADKMTSKLNDLERQISTLERFLANVEMSHAAGEITDELHNQEVDALNLGLEATKNELNFIKEAIMQLVPEETQAELTSQIETAETEEATPTETAVETLPEVPVTEPAEAPSVIDEADIEQPDEMMEKPETQEIPETPETPFETTEELTEEITKEITDETEGETISEEQETPETLTEEATSEELATEEIVTEEIVTEETIETPTEETEEATLEEEAVSETSTEENQPFPEDSQEE